MSADAIDSYVAVSLARWRQMDRSELVIDRPGLYGRLELDADTPMQLLVTDDRALPQLTALTAEHRSGVITVFTQADRCTRLLTGDPTWSSSPMTAMACGDLRAVPELVLPDDLELRPVCRTADDSPDRSVALTDAVDAVLLADPGEDAQALQARLRSLPGVVRILAAVDRDGIVRATSGWRLDDADARVFLVDTDPEWRRRGIATAMTSIALQAARTHGAKTATLGASPAGQSIYRRLGFQPVSEALTFRGPAS